MKNYLYRGVSCNLDVKLGGKLVPKRQETFLHEFTADTTEITCDNNKITIGPSQVNAVHWHQASQKGYSTSGISTTPHKERARIYAQGVNGDKSGYIYTLNRDQFSVNGVSEYIVSDYVTHPAVPEDDEVILVAINTTYIPEAIIISIEMA